MKFERCNLQAIAELQEFIALGSNVREVRKALAVKLIYQGYRYEEIQTILDVSVGSITSWKQGYESNGIEGLRLNHQGRKSYLSNEQKQEVSCWLQMKNCWELGELEYKRTAKPNLCFKKLWELLKLVWA